MINKVRLNYQRPGKFGSRINKTNWDTWWNHLEKVYDNTPLYAEKLNSLSARTYQNRMRQAISSQQYTASFVPLSDAYVEWKEEHYPKNAHKIWQMNEDVLRLIGSPTFLFTVPGQTFGGSTNTLAWLSGITPLNGSTVPQKPGNETGKSIWEYANIVENGGGKVPARPLFSIVREHYVPTWEMDTLKVINRIKNLWSRTI